MADDKTLPDEDEVEDSSLVLYAEQEEEAPDAATYRTERVREERFEPGDPAAGAAIVAMTLLKNYSVKDASNGANIVATVQVDSAYAVDFEDLIGETTYIFRVGKKDYGECRVMSVSTKADADNRAQTVVGLKWSQDQRKRTKDLTDIVGQSIRLELWTVELPVFGAKAE